MKIDNFIAELQRRNVYKVAVAYAVMAWLLIQIATQVFPFLEIPTWVVRAVIMLVIIGFPIALIIAWAFESTPQGIVRTTATGEPAGAVTRSRAWIYVVVICAVLSAALFFLGRYTAPKGRSSSADLAKSIAVLPFESLSEDKNNAYFADGIQDEILARLSKIADLKVISRTSTQKYKSAPDDLREIAQKLGVSNVLEGSVQKSNDQVRVTVQLINAINDSHLWAETYDRKLSDIFGVESEIAQKIAGSLAAKLTGREKEQVAALGTTNPQAYDALLHALALQHTIGGLDKSVEFSRRAVELDPNYSDAWAMLASLLAEKFDSVERTPELEPQARAAAENALRLAPDSAKAHDAMSTYYSSCRNDYPAALAEVEKARELAPNDGSILTDLGSLQRAAGKIGESLETLKRAADLDPLNPYPWAQLAFTYRGLRQYDEARSMWNRALAVVPGNTNILTLKASTYQDQGNLDAAWKILGPIFPNGKVPVYREQYRLWRDYGALIEFDKTRQDDPQILMAFGDALLANLYLLNDERDLGLLHAHKAQSEMQDVPRIVGGYVLSEFYIECLARLGNRDEVEREVQRLFAEAKDDQWILPDCKFWAARGYVLLGNLDKAIPLLEDSLAKPNGTTTAYLRLDPAFDGVRSDPRFQKLAEDKP